MSESWIKIYRRFLDWEWYGKSEMVHLFLHLLLKANVEDKRWQGFVIKRGQLITGRSRLIEETGISERTIRTCLQKLQETGEITVEASNRYSLITICNYDSYQERESESVQQTSSKRPTTDQQMSTTKEYIDSSVEESNKTKITRPKKTKADVAADTKKRMSDFYNSLVPYVNLYGKEMVRSFFDWWSETNKSGSRMRWEMEKTWVLEKRLQYWSRNEKSYRTKSNENSQSDNRTREERDRGASDLVTRLLAENKPVGQ
jgi:biotin operon repressor